jgi:predicted SprT family Zn-dependent metalloprotease
VFMGRCPRCRGFMQNDRERQFNERDEHVYRCFTCGWRTSPIYNENRALRARGMEVK